MTTNTKKLRDILIKDTWLKYSGLITKQDLAEIFNLDISGIYRILDKIAKAEPNKPNNK